jgi:hypothetical protein
MKHAPKPAALALLTFLSACGEPPRPLEPAPIAPADAGALPPGHPPVDAPSGASSGAPSGAPAEERFAGVVRLRGALAQTQDGQLTLLVRQKGVPMPLRMHRWVLSDAEIGREKDGERVLEFALGPTDVMAPGMAPPPLVGELEFKALYDLDGFVDTKADQVEVVVPVVIGQVDIDVTLQT